MNRRGFIKRTFAVLGAALGLPLAGCKWETEAPVEPNCDEQLQAFMETPEPEYITIPTYSGKFWYVDEENPNARDVDDGVHGRSWDCPFKNINFALDCATENDMVYIITPATVRKCININGSESTLVWGVRCN